LLSDKTNFIWESFLTNLRILHSKFFFCIRILLLTPEYFVCLLEEVLEGVAAGIDLFDSTYIYQLTMGGFALIFPIDMVGKETQNGPFDNDGRDSTKINLHATTYRYVTGLWK